MTLAWYWCSDDRILPRSGGLRAALGVAQNNPVDSHGEPGHLILCNRGYHGSIYALDGLSYAQGALVCRTRHSGAILHGGDKLCSERREILWVADATPVLHEFACWCADQALDLVESRGLPVDSRSRAAIAAKRAWLRGEIDDQTLAAARDAAWDAARDAAWDAARAARDAAWATAWAARDAAWDAARDAAWDAARDARDAAWDAARDAAWDAARAAQKHRLDSMLLQLAPAESEVSA